MQNFSPIQFVILDLWPIKDNLCRLVPGEQKLHFYLVVFHKNYNIFENPLSNLTENVKFTKF